MMTEYSFSGWRRRRLCGDRVFTFGWKRWWVWCWLKCCFTSTETVGLLGTGAQDVHLDFHTVPELVVSLWRQCILYGWQRRRVCGDRAASFGWKRWQGFSDQGSLMQSRWPSLPTWGLPAVDICWLCHTHFRHISCLFCQSCGPLFEHTVASAENRVDLS